MAETPARFFVIEGTHWVAWCDFKPLHVCLPVGLSSTEKMTIKRSEQGFDEVWKRFGAQVQMVVLLSAPGLMRALLTSRQHQRCLIDRFDSIDISDVREVAKLAFNHDCENPSKERLFKREPSPKRYTLYRAFDSESNLLYVGQTIRHGVRIHEHAASSGWWDQTAKIEVTHLRNAIELDDAEYKAIRDENPKYNIMR